MLWCSGLCVINAIGSNRASCVLLFIKSFCSNAIGSNRASCVLLSLCKFSEEVVRDHQVPDVPMLSPTKLSVNISPTKLSVNRQFLDLFGTVDSLSRFIVHVCNGMHQQSFTALARVFSILVKQPVQLIFSDIGLAPVQQYGTFVYPYTLMDSEQLAFCVETISQQPTTSADTTKARQVAGCVSKVRQVGGGVAIIRNQLFGDSLVMLDNGTVIIAFCRCIMSSDSQNSQGEFIQEETKRAICSMFLQHASCTCKIPLHIHDQLHEMCAVWGNHSRGNKRRKI